MLATLQLNNLKNTRLPWMEAQSSDILGACPLTLGKFKLNDIAHSTAGLWWKCEQTNKWQKSKFLGLDLSQLHTMTHRWSVHSVKPTLRLYGVLDGGFIVWCMTPKTEHKCTLCCRIQTQPLKWKMWFVCEHWKKQPKCQEGKSAPRKHQKLIWENNWAPKSQISYRQPRALL